MKVVLVRLPVSVLAVLGFTSWVCSDTLMKLAGEANLPPWEAVALVCLFGIILMTAKGAAQGSVAALWPRRPAQQAARVVIMLTSSMANVVALRHLPLALFYTAVFTAPLVISVLAALVLRERLTARHAIAIVAGFAGAVIAIDPFGSLTRGDLAGWAAMAVSVACFSAGAVWLRVITKSETNDSLAFCFGAVGILICGVPTAFTAVPLSISTLILFPAMAAFSLVGQLCNYSAMRRVPAATVSQFHYTQIVAGSALGYLIWRDVPAPSTVIGAAIIIAAGLYAARTAGRAQEAGPPVANELAGTAVGALQQSTNLG